MYVAAVQYILKLTVVTYKQTKQVCEYKQEGGGVAQCKELEFFLLVRVLVHRVVFGVGDVL
jgi:hypothetical protein